MPSQNGKIHTGHGQTLFPKHLGIHIEAIVDKHLKHGKFFKPNGIDNTIVDGWHLGRFPFLMAEIE